MPADAPDLPLLQIATDTGIMAMQYREVACPGPAYTPPAGCTTPVGAWQECGKSGPNQDGKCCPQFMSCQPDPNSNGNSWQCLSTSSG